MNTFQWNLSQFTHISFSKMHVKMSSLTRLSFCSGISMFLVYWLVLVAKEMRYFCEITAAQHQYYINDNNTSTIWKIVFQPLPYKAQLIPGNWVNTMAADMLGAGFASAIPAVILNVLSCEMRMSQVLVLRESKSQWSLDLCNCKIHDHVTRISNNFQVPHIESN